MVIEGHIRLIFVSSISNFVWLITYYCIIYWVLHGIISGSMSVSTSSALNSLFWECSQWDNWVQLLWKTQGECTSANVLYHLLTSCDHFCCFSLFSDILVYHRGIGLLTLLTCNSWITNYCLLILMPSGSGPCAGTRSAFSNLPLLQLLQAGIADKNIVKMFKVSGIYRAREGLIQVLFNPLLECSNAYSGNAIGPGHGSVH